MNFTMKILAVSVLLVAMMALALATEAPPQAEAAAVTEAPVKEDEAADDSSNEAADDSSSEAADDSSNEAADDSSNEEAADDSSNEEEADDSSNEETESEDEEGEEAESTEGEKTHEVAKRSCRCRCRGGGWRRYGKIYYRYFSSSRTWARAQYYCRAIGGNLASVHSTYENNVIRAVARNRAVWIGFSDAQQNGYWFWSDGTRFNYQKWCSGQPDNSGRKQHCAYKRGTCWDDVSCSSRLPFVCVRRRC
ncbi:type-2 ice-structuring protein-like isoform X3 [Larimichthys crocea]|uniref:type-2 ice-structuring protein-like isoform X3 n=1 Tax=Larimichthys crocea TaxID=215358 RepID=UPI000F5F5987|nr:type-2 ice-structuring protein-like isoform X3 [Larimichthys crocea]